VAAENIEVLRQARESFVRKRRAMAEQMVPAGAAAQHFAPAFSDLQNAIEAIDRAIADEEKLPVGYAAEEPDRSEMSSQAGNETQTSNVVDVDFETT
jgi:hypothetical protein